MTLRAKLLGLLIVGTLVALVWEPFGSLADPVQDGPRPDTVRTPVTIPTTDAPAPSTPTVLPRPRCRDRPAAQPELLCEAEPPAAAPSCGV